MCKSYTALKSLPTFPSASKKAKLSIPPIRADWDSFNWFDVYSFSLSSFRTETSAVLICWKVRAPLKIVLSRLPNDDFMNNFVCLLLSYWQVRCMTAIVVSISDSSLKKCVRRTCNVCSTLVRPSVISVVISIATAIGWFLVLLFAAHCLALSLAWAV